MKIDDARPSELKRLSEIWEAAVRATHHFLSEEDIVGYRPLVAEGLAKTALLAARDEEGRALGFMGIEAPTADSPARIPVLFIDPAHHGQGIGRALIEEAARRHGDLNLEVNEQNPGAQVFYKKMGFEVMGRSELDNEGRPFPLLHLHRKAFPA